MLEKTGVGTFLSGGVDDQDHQVVYFDRSTAPGDHYVVYLTGGPLQETNMWSI